MRRAERSDRSPTNPRLFAFYIPANERNVVRLGKRQ